MPFLQTSMTFVQLKITINAYRANTLVLVPTLKLISFLFSLDANQTIRICKEMPLLQSTVAESCLNDFILTIHASVFGKIVKCN